MLLSLGLILILGFISGFLLNKIKIPGLIGMIIVGLLIGPYCLNLIDESILNISSQLRQIALVIILTRSGLSLDINKLKKVGRPALLMCFLPATFEIIGVALASYFILSLSIFESLLLGAVLGAVSPAVVAPRMINFINKGYGKEHHVPELVLAGASLDDVYTIVLFYSFLGIVKNNSFNGLSIALVPASIASGILLGIGCGFLLSSIFKHTSWSKVINVIIMLSTSFLMVGIEELLKQYFDISALVGVMVMAMIILLKSKEKANELSNSYNNIWKVFEIILFVLVGATINFNYAINNFLPSLLVLIIGLSFRVIGVILCSIKTNLTFKERIFTIIAYLPKATVQASIGGIALSEGLNCGSSILTVSIISILITASFGAILIDRLTPKLLVK